MIQAAIYIELIDGTKIRYVRDVLAAKSGNDGATPSNLLFAGYPGKYYCYTGAGTDTYTAQTATGQIAGDLASLQTSLAASTPTALSFPDSTPTTTLVRYNNDIGSGKNSYIRTTVQKSSIAKISVEEKWTVSALEPDARNTLPSWSTNFRTDGWNEETQTFTMPTATAGILPKVETTFTSTANSITLNWLLNSAYSTYKVYLNDKIVATGLTVKTYTFSNLIPGNKYVVGVSGISSDGSESSISTKEVKLAMSATTITATSKVNSIDLSWTVVPTAVTYKVYVNNKLFVRYMTGTTLTISSLTPSTTYSIKIVAVGKSVTNTSTATASSTTKAS